MLLLTATRFIRGFIASDAGSSGRTELARWAHGTLVQGFSIAFSAPTGVGRLGVALALDSPFASAGSAVARFS